MKSLTKKCMIMFLVVLLSVTWIGPVDAADNDHVIYDVEWKSDHSAEISLKWSNPDNDTPIMITSWSVNDDESVTVRYSQGSGVSEGFSSRRVSDDKMNCPCVIRLEENVSGGGSEIFPDMPVDAEAEKAISHLYFLGVINGYPDGDFKPEGNVSRAEFSKMLYISGGMSDELESPITFNDVASGYWAENYIYTLATKGIVNGKGDGVFDPSGTITISEVIAIIDRSFNTYGESSDYGYELADHWSNENFVSLAQSGIVKPSDDYYYPYTPSKIATREDCAILLSRVLSDYYEVN